MAEPPSAIPPPSSSGGALPTPPSGPISSGSGMLKGYQISSSGNMGQLPQEMVSDVLSHLNANNLNGAEKAFQQLKVFTERPDLFNKQIAELLGGAKAQIEEKHLGEKIPEPYRHLLYAVEKVLFGWTNPDEKPNPLHSMRSAELLEKVARRDDDIRQLIKELALTILPESFNYVLEGAWMSLLGEQRYVILAGITFAPRPFATMLTALQKNEHLLSLSLSACEIKIKEQEKVMDDNEAKLIATAFKEHPSLKRLHFSYHQMSHQGIASLAELIPTLEYLNLTANRIDDKGAEILSTKLSKESGRFKQLILDINSIGNQGAEKLSLSLKSSSSLQVLSLWGNLIGMKGVTFLNNALQEGNALFKRMDIGDNRLSEGELDSFRSKGDPRISF